MTENTVFSYLKLGNEKKAVELLYKKVFPGSKKYLLSNKCDSQQAQDLFHDNLIKLLLKIRKSEIDETVNVENYLFVMVKNSWVKLAQKNKRVIYQDEVKEEKVETDFMLEDEQKEKRKRVREALNKLGDTCKELLMLTFYMECSLDEVTEKMGFSNKGVTKTYHYRCKKKMFELVKNDKSLIALMR